MDKLALALAILRGDLPSELTKRAGAIRSILSAGNQAGKAASKVLTDAGHKNLGAVARVTPHAALGLGAYKAYESEPAQRTRMKIHEFRMRRAVKRAQKMQRAQQLAQMRGY